MDFCHKLYLLPNNLILIINIFWSFSRIPCCAFRTTFPLMREFDPINNILSLLKMSLLGFTVIHVMFDCFKWTNFIANANHFKSCFTLLCSSLGRHSGAVVSTASRQEGPALTKAVFLWEVYMSIPYMCGFPPTVLRHEDVSVAHRCEMSLCSVLCTPPCTYS